MSARPVEPVPPRMSARITVSSAPPPGTIGGPILLKRAPAASALRLTAVDDPLEYDAFARDPARRRHGLLSYDGYPRMAHAWVSVAPRLPACGVIDIPRR